MGPGARNEGPVTRTGTMGHDCGARNPVPGTRSHPQGTMAMDQGAGTRDQEPWTRNHAPRTKDHESGARDRGSNTIGKTKKRRAVMAYAFRKIMPLEIAAADKDRMVGYKATRLQP